MNQYRKKSPFNIKKKGKTRVKTDKRGNVFGAKKGKTYAIKVITVTTIFRKNIILLNHERRFILCSVLVFEI